MNTNKLLATNAYEEALQWSEREGEIRLGQKIRVTFTGLKPKTGYAYKEEGAWLGIRYQWRSMRWWSLLNYNTPLIKLEAQEMSVGGNPYWVTIWERKSELKKWVEDRQLNGDDGSGFNDYEEESEL